MTSPAARPDHGGSALGQLLRHHRVAGGLSQRELARRSGISERAVRDLERGAVARPRPGSVRALATGLGLAGDDAAAFVAAAGPRPPRRLVPAAIARRSPTDLVGRRAELRTLIDLVTGARYRLVTVTGPGGVGKSRLVAVAVTILRGQTNLPVYTLDLSGLGEPNLLGEAVAAPGLARSAPVARVAAELRDRPAVLVLDCLERLVDAAPVLADLLRACPGLTVLGTSRRPLGLTGERRLPLGPLPAADAADLFVQCATAAAPGFALSAENAPAIRSICAAVDGLPLAIELAAARMHVLTPSELAARLDRPLEVLTGGSRDAPGRHWSLRAAIESSLDLLGEPARTLLAWLAPFAGGARLADVEQVAHGLGGESGWVVGALTGLVDAGMVRVRDDGTRSRYVLPDAVRQLAAELLLADGDDAAVRDAVARRYLHRLREADATPDGSGFADLDPELDNVRSAIDWARSHRPSLLDTPTVRALYRFHDLRGRYGEGRATLVAVAESGAAGGAWALVGAANFSRMLQDPASTEDLVGRAEALLPGPVGGGPDSGDTDEVRAAAALLRGNLAIDGGDLRAALGHHGEVAEAARRAGDAQTLGRALNNLGGVALMLRELASAERYYREALAVSGVPARRTATSASS